MARLKKINTAFRDELVSVWKDAEKNACEVMAEQNIKPICFVNNKNTFDVTRVYAAVDSYVENKIIDDEVVLLVAEDNQLFILTEESADYDDLNIFKEKGDVFSTEAWNEIESTLTDITENLTLLEETFYPTSLAVSITETLSEIFNITEYKPFGINEIRKLS